MAAEVDTTVTSQTDLAVSEILSSLDSEFSQRYTDEDPDYKDAGQPQVPPCVENWYSRPRRMHDYTQSNRLVLPGLWEPLNAVGMWLS